jgi:hypothetical protein
MNSEIQANDVALSYVSISIDGEELLPDQVNVIRIAMQEFADRYRSEGATAAGESARKRARDNCEKASDLFLLLYP